MTFVIVCIVSFCSCKKDVMKEENVIEMFSKLDELKFSNDSSILQFASTKDFETVVKILKEYEIKGTKKKYDIEDPILYAFEEKYNKGSLRRSIIKKTDELEAKDSLFEYNDPDDMYVQDDVIRSILNKKNAFKIDKSTFVVLEGVTVNYYGNLSYIIDSINNIYIHYPDVDDLICALENFSSSVADIALITNYERNNCEADFTFIADYNDPYTIYFRNHSDYDDGISYKWDFGDGTSSYESSPTHTFPQSSSTYNVQLCVYDNGIECDRYSLPIQLGNCKSNFTYNKSGDSYVFTSLATAIDVINEYIWDFGDGTTGNGLSCTHTYQMANEYYVKHTIVTNSCKDEKTDTVKITVAADCCKKNEREVIKDTNVNNGNNKIKLVLASTSVWPVRNVTSKVKFFKKKNNGSYKKENASYIYSSHTGRIYWDSDCPNDKGTNISNYGSETNDNKCVVRTPSNTPIYLRKNSITSYYKIIYQGHTYEGPGPILHNEKCK